VAAKLTAFVRCYVHSYGYSNDVIAEMLDTQTHVDVNSLSQSIQCSRGG
jgi:hypothetical protein